MKRILEGVSVATEEAIGTHFAIEAIPILQGNQGNVSAQLILGDRVVSGSELKMFREHIPKPKIPTLFVL